MICQHGLRIAVYAWPFWGENLIIPNLSMNSIRDNMVSVLLFVTRGMVWIEYDMFWKHDEALKYTLNFGFITNQWDCTIEK